MARGYVWEQGNGQGQTGPIRSYLAHKTPGKSH